ncbi:uncharacterized protein K452DRAFT_229475 [Aplosporella prunicola CBS 121167]|uniref:Uncharacterized protein n=1 Tax=Aplosporella prunicola CBS 121167 TaxID=1176127 RepID=A0A6A6BCJ0_9PEZI|nr:uncharacterized protein K452DRAFT_229475 [Aplosporella prunicola CBS 121167]KAF2141073.1 hypothetical protein K452DRAFT_229475 [Aplosporella prunicola CBS 121167]
MAPTRRYLRITRYSALEVRVYLDNPALQDTWLLRPSDPALPRIIQAVRPLVLPKLWEESERVKGKAKGNNKGVRDVVAGDDFEVSIFLTENSSPHSLLTKSKTFKDKPRLKSNSGKLTAWLSAGNTSDKPVDVDDDAPLALNDIPEATPPTRPSRRRSGNKRQRALQEEDEIDEDALFVSQPDHPDPDSSESSDDAYERPTKRKRRSPPKDDAPADDKKKLALNTSYDGFSIYGRVLCLVVKRKGGGSSSAQKATTGPAAQQQSSSTAASS